MTGDSLAENPLKRAAKSIIPRDSLVLLGLVIVAVLWATLNGTLPGGGMKVVGGIAEAVLWACMYAGLGTAYCHASLMEGRFDRGVLNKLGLGLLLAVISTRILVLLLPPAAWGRFCYLRYLSPPAFAALWCTALLPRQTRVLCGIAGKSRISSLLSPVAILLAVAAVLVTCADLALQLGVTSESATHQSFMQGHAWVTNILILFSAYALALAITSKVSTSLLFVSPFYVALGVATLLKLKYMHTAVVPLDLISTPEFLPLFRSFFGTGVLIATVCGLAAWILGLVALRRIKPHRIPLVARWSTGFFSLVVLLAVPTLYSSGEHYWRIYRLIGSPDFLLTKDFPRENGFLLTFLAEIPSSLVVRPADYSPATVAGASRQFLQPAIAPADSSRGRRVNLIVYMVESFMDPDDLGLHYTSDPIPNLRELQRASINGYAIVPGRFGGSINSEFEVLTGMTLFFLPDRSIPFRQFIDHPMPSLPSALKNLGYQTIAIQADPEEWFNRKQAYDMLGFDKTAWLYEQPGIERAARGRWPSDRAVVQRIIEASQQSRPFFIFAFPSGLHSPYNRGLYRHSDLNVLDPPGGDAADEVKEYINEQRVSDQAIGMLIEHFRHRSEPTIIAVFGDHVPPLSDGALSSFFSNLSGMSSAEQDWRAHRVPLLVWANFDLPREKVDLSLNFLPSYLLEKMEIAPSGLLALTDAVRRRMPILSGHVRGADGAVWEPDSLPRNEEALVDAYRLLQYDLTLGEQYSLRDSTTVSGLSTAISGASH